MGPTASGKDPLFEFMTWILPLQRRPSDWEARFAAAFEKSALAKRVARKLAHDFSGDQGVVADDVLQVLAMTLLQKTRDRALEIEGEGRLNNLLTTIGRRYCLKANQQVWDVVPQVGQDLGAEGLQAQDADDNLPADLIDHRDPAVLADEKPRPRAITQLRAYMKASSDRGKSVHNSPTMQNSQNRNMKTVKTGDGVLSTRLPSALHGVVNLEGVQALLRNSPGRPPGPTRLTRSAQDHRRPDQMELHELWVKSRLTQADYATSIEVSAASLKAYMYGKTKAVPADVLERARKLSNETEGFVKKLDAMFDVPMKEILDRWREKLGIEQTKNSAGYQEIATILGVHHTTVLRWEQGSKPQVRDLARYEQRVNGWAKNKR